MKLITAQEVMEREAESINAVTSLVQTWIPKMSQRLGVTVPEDLEVVIVPGPFILDENQMPVQASVFYDDNEEIIEQVQIAGVWMVGRLEVDEFGQDQVVQYSVDHPLYVRSLVETVCLVLLEIRESMKEAIPMDLRDVVRAQMRKEATEVVSEFLGPAPEGWVTGGFEEDTVDEEELPTPSKKTWVN